jgi:hypothetical protein
MAKDLEGKTEAMAGPEKDANDTPAEKKRDAVMLVNVNRKPLRPNSGYPMLGKKGQKPFRKPGPNEVVRTKQLEKPVNKPLRANLTK